jgi:uncharacterized membrane protein YbhN (UPF0104 family)
VTARGRLVAVGKYAFGLGVLVLVVARNWRSPPDAPGTGLADVWSQLNGWPLTPALVCMTVGLCLTLVRWWALARAIDLPLALRDAVRIGLFGYFFNAILPGGIGGDAVKIASVVRTQDRRTAAVASILFDRIVGLTGLVMLVAAAGLAFWATGHLTPDERLFAIVRGSWIGMAVVTAGWLTLGWMPAAVEDRLDARLRRIPKVGRVLAEALRATWTYRRRPGAVGIAIALSLTNHLIGVPGFYFAAHVSSPAPGDIPTLGQHYLLVPAGLAVKALFPAPGGIGGGEWSFGRLYAMAGAAPARGILASLVVLACTWALGAIAYIVALRLGPSPARPGAEPRSPIDQE